MTFQRYHVTQRLVGTYSVGSKTESIRPRPWPRLVWDWSCHNTAVSDPKTGYATQTSHNTPLSSSLPCLHSGSTNNICNGRKKTKNTDRKKETI